VSLPTPGTDGTLAVTRELTAAFLATKAARDRIREVVEYRVPKGTQEADVEEIVQNALVRALTTTSLAQTVTSLRPWVSRIAQNEVIDQYRRDLKHLVWLNREVDVQELPPDPATEDDDEPPPRKLDAVPRPTAETPTGMLGAWIDGQRLTKADRLTLEMIRDLAKNGGTNAALAARFGMTETAWDSRLTRFKDKYVPRWQRHRRNRIVILLVVGGILIALALAALRWLSRPPSDVHPDLSVAPRRTAPSASASAAPPDDGRRNEALPPERAPDKPQPDKPNP
jgi:DNA-directed RNA polymerase specialized sigma24 family protein